ncbi:MAG: FAD-dependent oxidoreductase [Microgenomates group bacterium]|nr:FAD-dependent oxidoreductase [Microgenomates group bacterium]
MLNLYKTLLKNKTQLSDSVYLFNFDLVDPPEFSFSPGQYLLLEVPQSGDEPIKRPYSIASSNQQKNRFDLIVQIIPQGRATSYLSSLKSGDKVIFYGPAGVFTLRPNLKNKIFLATGCGIAPVRSMIFSLYKISDFSLLSDFNSAPKETKSDNLDDRQNGIIKNDFQKLDKQDSIDVKLFWGLRYYQDIYLYEEFKKPSEKPVNFQFKICLSREYSLKQISSTEQKYFSFGHINKEIEKLFLNQKRDRSVFTKTDFYLCGGREIVDSLRNFLLEKGIKETNIYFEKY